MWKEGRLGLRLTDPDAYDGLMNQPGASPWKAGKMVMSHWVLVPDGFHANKRLLSQWAKKAHGCSLTNPKEKKQKNPSKLKSARVT